MNFNRKYAALATVITLVVLGVGAFRFSSSGSTAPKAPATAQSITAKARDTSGAALSGVAVELTGPDNAKVTSGTTGAGGQVALSFNPDPGTYVLTATEPTGYRARDDKDGGASDNSGLTCGGVYLCIYLTATEMQNTDGSTFMRVQLTHVRPEQVSELDDLWFELTPPPTAVEEETSVIEPTDDEILIDDPADDVLIGDPADETPIDDPGDDEAAAFDDDIVVEPIGLRRLCAGVLHQPVDEQKSASGIWVRGEVYGLDGGWIWVEGPTINNGEPVKIPIADSQFDGPLGINSYADHAVERFELQGPGADDAPIDLLPTLLGGPGTTFPVGPDEGSIFDDECFDFDPPVAGEQSVEQTSEQQAEAQRAATQAEVDAFFDAFVDDHTTGNTADLLETLHPAIPLAFGDEICTAYVTRTAGSIAGATVLDVQLPRSVDMETPDGLITFADAVPVQVEFTLVDGSTVVNDANLAQHDGATHWLTRCGVDD